MGLGLGLGVRVRSESVVDLVLSPDQLLLLLRWLQQRLGVEGWVGVRVGLRSELVEEPELSPERPTLLAGFGSGVSDGGLGLRER